MVQSKEKTVNQIFEKYNLTSTRRIKGDDSRVFVCVQCVGTGLTGWVS